MRLLHTTLVCERNTVRRAPLSLSPLGRRSSSTVERGTAFERAVHARLESWGARLRPCGGAFDQAVDLAGTWHLPWAPSVAIHDRVSLAALVQAPLTVPTVVQCKATAKPLGVAALREIQHAIAARFPPGALVCVACTGGFALRSLARERSWVLRDTLLLTLSPSGVLLAASALQVPPRGDAPAPPRASFIVTPLCNDASHTLAPTQLL